MASQTVAKEPVLAPSFYYVARAEVRGRAALLTRWRGCSALFEAQWWRCFRRLHAIEIRVSAVHAVSETTIAEDVVQAARNKSHKPGGPRT